MMDVLWWGAKFRARNSLGHHSRGLLPNAYISAAELI
jgi:hypothetical protein